MFARTGNNHGLENLRWIEGRCVHETQKRVWSYLQPFSDASQKFPKYAEQYLYKIPLLFSELFSSIFKFLGNLAACFGIYLGWVSCTNLSWFESRQPHSKIFRVIFRLVNLKRNYPRKLVTTLIRMVTNFFPS